MGLGSFLGGITEGLGIGGEVSAGDLLGGFSGSTGRKAAEEARDITTAELNRQFDLTQENLRPALDAAQRQLPGIQEQLTPGGFGGALSALGPELEAFLAPTRAGRSDVGIEQLRMAGLSPSAGVGQELSQIDPSTMADLLLGAEGDLFSNRISLSGLGQGAGGVLSELGQRTGSGIADAAMQAQLQGQQATAAGQQNALAVAGLLSSFSDERLKKNIKELARFKGLRVISWDWEDFVPESWKGVTVGFSAQDVLEAYPQFVSVQQGFLAIQRDQLINHLESI